MSRIEHAAFYDCRVTHRRADPGHTVTHRLTMAYLDLDSCDAPGPRSRVTGAGPGARFVRGDYLDGSDRPLRGALAEVLGDHGRQLTGPVRILTQLRTLGWLFNPLTTYYCFSADGPLEQVVLEVTNTPWHERHWYVLDADEPQAILRKQMHVSPFLGMDLRYRLRSPAPDQDLRLDMDVEDPGGDVVLSARLRGRQIAAPTGVIRNATQTVQVSAQIYANAAALAARGARFHAHPRTGRADATPERTRR